MHAWVCANSMRVTTRDACSGLHRRTHDHAPVFTTTQSTWLLEVTAVDVPKPKSALVPPIPASLAVATPAVMASLPISIFDAVVVSVTPTAPSARIFSPVVALLTVNLFRFELYDTVTP